MMLSSPAQRRVYNETAVSGRDEMSSTGGGGGNTTFASTCLALSDLTSFGA